MEDDDSYWNESNVSKNKGFSWDESIDSGEVSLSRLSINKNDNVVSFEAVPSSHSSRWQEKVREASRQIATAAQVPEPSISQIVGVRDPAKLEAELVMVRKALAKLQDNRFSPSPPQQTVEDIILGRPYSLSGYVSLKDKVELLDSALDLGDGGAILEITLMLQTTLKSTKFMEILELRPTAADQLVAHLVTRHEHSKLTELLSALGRRQEASVVAFKQATASSTLETKVKKLKDVLHVHSHNAEHFIEQINLWERLSPVIASDTTGTSGGLATASVLRALLYLCTHHWGAGENLLHSPAGIRRTHKLTDKQYTWVALRARATVGAWSDCESVVVGKGWLGGKKVKGSVSAPAVVTALHQAGAPPETLAAFLPLVDGLEERISLARKVGVAAVVVDVLVAMKDRQGLVQFQDSLVPSSRDWFYAENALRASSAKWKN